MNFTPGSQPSMPVFSPQDMYSQMQTAYLNAMYGRSNAVGAWEQAHPNTTRIDPTGQTQQQNQTSFDQLIGSTPFPNVDPATAFAPILQQIQAHNQSAQNAYNNVQMGGNYGGGVLPGAPPYSGYTGISQIVDDGWSNPFGNPNGGSLPNKEAPSMMSPFSPWAGSALAPPGQNLPSLHGAPPPPPNPNDSPTSNSFSPSFNSPGMAYMGNNPTNSSSWGTPSPSYNAPGGLGGLGGQQPQQQQQSSAWGGPWGLRNQWSPA